MRENLTNLAGLSETLESISSLMRWTVGICALGAAVLLVLFISAQVRIVRRRREMKRYARFLRTHYGKGPVPVMLYRYWDREVTAYNWARRRWPYRALWEKANAGEFTPQTPSPPKRPVPPAKAAEGDAEGDTNPPKSALRPPGENRPPGTGHRLRDTRRDSFAPPPGPGKRITIQGRMPEPDADTGAASSMADGRPTGKITPREQFRERRKGTQ